MLTALSASALQHLDGGNPCCRSIRTPAPRLPSAPRSPAPMSAPASSPSAMAVHRDHPQVAQAWCGRLPGPLGPAAPLPWKATEEERAIVCTLRRATNFALDDLTFVITHFLPHLNRDSIWRILKAEGLNRRPKPARHNRKGQGTVQGLRPRLRPYRHQAPAQAADRRWRTAQALSLCRHRPPLALGPPRRQGRRDREPAPSPSCVKPRQPFPSA